MERLVEPIIADLQVEYTKAIGDGRRWRAGAILIAGYAGLAKAFVLHLLHVLTNVGSWSESDRRAIARALTVGTIVMAVVTVILSIPQMASTGWNAGAMLYLIPQALPLAFSAGIAIGTVAGLVGRMTARTACVVVLLSILLSAASLADMNWFSPVSNQAFRESVFQTRPLGRGLFELSLGELRSQMRGEQVPNFGFPPDPTAASTMYHLRWAMACESIAFAIFALSIAGVGGRRFWLAMGSTVAAWIGHYALVDVMFSKGQGGVVPPIASAWLANLSLMLLAGVLLALWGFRSSSAYRGEPTTS